MNGFKAALVKLLLHAVALLPLTWARSMGRGVALLYWPFRGSSRRVTERNIALAFPELDTASQARLARESLAATGGLVAAAQREGRGVVVLGPHLGNWELAGLRVAQLGKTVILYEKPQLAGLDFLMRRSRQRNGIELVTADRRGIARLLGNLREGNITAILPDQVPRDVSAGKNVPFMGVECFTATLACNLIRRSGALAVFCMALRTPRGFSLHYLPAEEAIYSADDTVALAALNRGVETCLRQCPEQYQWEYKRFKVRPRTGPGVYHDL